MKDFAYLLEHVTTSVLLRASVGALALGVAGLFLIGADRLMPFAPVPAWFLVLAAVPFVCGFVAEVWWSVLYVLSASSRQRVISSAVAEVESEVVDADPWQGRAGLVGSGVVRESVRIVPYQGTFSFVDAVPEGDLFEFVQQSTVRGYAFRDWQGYRLPSGRVVGSWKVWRALVDPLVKVGVIEIVPRAPVRVKVTNPDEVVKLLGINPAEDGGRVVDQSV